MALPLFYFLLLASMLKGARAWGLMGRAVLTSLDRNSGSERELWPDFLLADFHHRTMSLAAPRLRTPLISHFRSPSGLSRVHFLCLQPCSIHGGRQIGTIQTFCFSSTRRASLYIKFWNSRGWKAVKPGSNGWKNKLVISDFVKTIDIHQQS